MKKPLTTRLVMLAAILAAPLSSLAVAETGGVQTLRGSDVATADQAPEDRPYVGKTPGEQEIIARTYAQQPPLIPHKIDGYRIDFKGNRCLECHDRPFYKQEEAPKIGDSHYRDREGKELKHIWMGRYECTQCHVPQADAKPLVENSFQSVPFKAAKDK